VKRIAAVTLLLLMGGCKPPEESRMKAIIGAVLIDPGMPPVSRSVLVVAGSRIRLVGDQASTPVPAGTEKVDGSGKFLIPAAVEIPDVEKLPKVTTLAEAKKLVEEGAAVLAGMITDTEECDQKFIQQLRDLRVVFVPRLHEQGSEVAARNALSLARLGVLIAAAGGKNGKQEWEAMAKAGFTAQEVFEAATANAARAAGKWEESGALTPGLKANVWLLSGNPLENVANLSRVERILEEGEWKQ